MWASDFGCLSGGEPIGKSRHAAFPFWASRDRSVHSDAIRMFLPLVAAERQERSDWSERGSGKAEHPTLSTDALRPLMTKQSENKALNMAKFIQESGPCSRWRSLTSLISMRGGLCEKHDDAEHLFRTQSSRLYELQDGNWWPEGLLVKQHGLLRLVALLFTRWLLVQSKLHLCCKARKGRRSCIDTSELIRSVWFSWWCHRWCKSDAESWVLEI